METVTATDPLIIEVMARTEKKMDMSLDDIVKMSKTTTRPKKQRASNKSWKVSNNTSQDKSAKLQRFLNSRSSVRQGALAQRRSNFQSNQFPLTTEAAQKVAAAPTGNGAYNRNKRVNWTKSRVSSEQRTHTQKLAGNVGFRVQKRQQDRGTSKQDKSQTMDSLFANLKQQRMRMLFNQQNNGMKRQQGKGRYGN